MTTTNSPPFLSTYAIPPPAEVWNLFPFSWVRANFDDLLWPRECSGSDWVPFLSLTLKRTGSFPFCSWNPYPACKESNHLAGEKGQDKLAQGMGHVKSSHLGMSAPAKCSNEWLQPIYHVKSFSWGKPQNHKKEKITVLKVTINLNGDTLNN